MRSRRGVASGVAVVVVYLLALGATVALRGSHVRPLYDGIAPPPAYSWVAPPAFWAAGNVKPAAATAVVELGAAGSVAAGVGTPDGQFTIDLGRAAIARHGADREVRVAITPVDPKRLARVPAGLRANGNAYRVEMTYEPSGAPVASITTAGSLLIEIPELGNQLFRSGGGQSWTSVEARAVPPRDLSLSASFTGPAYFLAATNLPELEGPTGARSSHRSIELGLITAALAVALLLLAAAVVRRRRLPR